MRNQKCVKSFTLFHTFILYVPLKRKIVHNLDIGWRTYRKIEQSFEVMEIKNSLSFNDFLKFEFFKFVQ